MVVCPTIEITEFMSKKWNVTLIELIARKPNITPISLTNEFDEISLQLVSKRLEKFELLGLVKKTFHQDDIVPSYELTQKGLDLYKIGIELKKWVAQHSSVKTCSATNCAKCTIHKNLPE